MRIGQLFPPAAPTPCRPSARPPPALLPRDAAAPRRGECRRAPPRRPNRQAAPSGTRPHSLPRASRAQSGACAHLAETDEVGLLPEALAAHEDVVLPDEAGLAGAHAAAHPSGASGGARSVRQAHNVGGGRLGGGLAGAPLAAALGRLGVVGEDEVRHNGRCRPADLPPSACAAVQSPGVG